MYFFLAIRPFSSDSLSDVIKCDKNAGVDVTLSSHLVGSAVLSALLVFDVVPIVAFCLTLVMVTGCGSSSQSLSQSFFVPFLRFLQQGDGLVVRGFEEAFKAFERI